RPLEPDRGTELGVYVHVLERSLTLVLTAVRAPRAVRLVLWPVAHAAAAMRMLAARLGRPAKTALGAALALLCIDVALGAALDAADSSNSGDAAGNALGGATFAALALVLLDALLLRRRCARRIASRIRVVLSASRRLADLLRHVATGPARRL